MLQLTLACTTALASLVLSQGNWKVIGDSGVVCIHTALLPNSRILCSERPHVAPYPINAFTNGRVSTEIDLGDASNPVKATVKPIITNPFCGGHAQTASGNILHVGGENGTFSDPDGTVFLMNGKQSTRIFYACKQGNTSSAWTAQPNMTRNRWYPTVATLGDGSAIIIGGSMGSFSFDDLLNPVAKALQDNPTYEYFPQKPAANPKNLDVITGIFPYTLYPPVFQLPNGKVFIFASNKTALLNPVDESVDNDSIKPILIDDKQPWIYPYTPTAIMLPLTVANNFTAAIQICGGSHLNTSQTDNRCILLDWKNPNPQWALSDSMPSSRVMPDSVLLPDGTILYTNGASAGIAGGNAGNYDKRGAPMLPVFETYIFDPKKPTGSRYTQVASATVPRLYHSGALLIPDGRVITMGSEEQNYVDVNAKRTNCMPFVEVACTSPFETRLEAFEPPYLSLPQTRPVISAVQGSLTYGSTFMINTTTNARDIDFVSFIRYSTVTHSTNTDQRLVELIIVGAEANALYLRAPSNSNLAPPGNWMLFIVNNGKPSAASTILLGPGPAAQVSVPATATVNASAKANGSFKSSIGFSAVFFGLVLSAL